MRHADADAYGHAYGDAYPYGYADSYSYSYAYSHGYTHAYAYGDPDGHGDGYCNSNANSYRNTEGYTDAETASDAGTAPNSVALLRRLKGGNLREKLASSQPAVSPARSSFVQRSRWPWPKGDATTRTHSQSSRGGGAAQRTVASVDFARSALDENRTGVRMNEQEQEQEQEH
jgi:hypothetical protein